MAPHSNPSIDLPATALVTYDPDSTGNITQLGGRSFADFGPLNLAATMTAANGLVTEHTYDASGGKQRTQLGSDEVRTYAGPGVAIDGSLKYIQHDDGRFVFGQEALSSTGIGFQYKIQDHLGNTVVLFEDQNEDGEISEEEVLQRELYYPFGLPLDNYCPMSSPSPAQPFLYNGKEYVAEGGLNVYFYGARWYDPAVGRFTGVDPIAAEFAHVSGYNYAENDPVGYVDLWGLQKREFMGVFDPNSWKSVERGGMAQLKKDKEYFYAGLGFGFAAGAVAAAALYTAPTTGRYTLQFARSHLASGRIFATNFAIDFGIQATLSTANGDHVMENYDYTGGIASAFANPVAGSLLDGTLDIVITRPKDGGPGLALGIEVRSMESAAAYGGIGLLSRYGGRVLQEAAEVSSDFTKPIFTGVQNAVETLTTSMKAVINEATSCKDSCNEK